MNFTRKEANAPVALWQGGAVRGANSGDAQALDRCPINLSSFNSFYGDLVTTAEGEALGSISDLWIDLASGKVAYAIVASGGFMGKGEQHYPVPWTALSRRPEDHTFRLAIQKRQFLSAPTVDRATLATGLSQNLLAAIRDHYGDATRRRW